MMIAMKVAKQLNCQMCLFSKGKIGGNLKPPISPFNKQTPPPIKPNRLSNLGTPTPRVQTSANNKIKMEATNEIAGSINIKHEEKFELKPKSAVITIMGHVDHGKTTLIDYLRSSNIAAKQDGGITQRIGAFRINCLNKPLTFIDTPGHQAFMNMRLRGASMTDLVVLVVSAVEGVKNQTLEVIKLIKKMDLRVIVAINKIDLPQANPQQIQIELQKAGLNLEQNGGDVPVVHISAKTGTNIDLLCELIVEDTKDKTAIFDCLAQASVLEAYQDKQGSNSMTIIMQRGTLRTNSMLILGHQSFRAKIIKDDNGNMLNQIYPGQAAQIIGIPFIPAPGDQVIEVENQKKAIFVAEQKKKQSYQTQRSKQESGSIKSPKIKFYRGRVGRRQKRAFFRGVREVWMNKFQEQQDKILEVLQTLESTEKTPEIIQLIDQQIVKLQEHRKYVFEYLKNTGEDNNHLNFIIKFGDRGMQETIMIQLQKIKPALEQETKVKLNLIKSDVGDVTVGDIEEARNTNAKIFTFGSSVSSQARSILDYSQEAPRTHKLIHNLLKDLKQSCFNKKIASINGKQRGRCEIAQVFALKIKKGTSKVPGVMMTSGKIGKNMKCYIFRNKIPISEGFSISFIKSFKKQMSELKKGEEGTIGFIENIDIQIEKGDQIVAFQQF